MDKYIAYRILQHLINPGGMPKFQDLPPDKVQLTFIMLLKSGKVIRVAENHYEDSSKDVAFETSNLGKELLKELKNQLNL